MATKEVQYPKGADGYSAMVADFSSLFSWDAVEAGSGFTEFKKNCGGNTYVGLQVAQNENNPPLIHATCCNGLNKFVVTQSSSSNCTNVAYSYGGGYFAFCTNANTMPSNSAGHYGGISTCRNLRTGDTSWGSFLRYYGNSNVTVNTYYLLSKDTQGNPYPRYTDWGLTQYAKVGSATALHEPTTGNVADKIMMLSAIPDNVLSCNTPVFFNGSSYTRLGILLVPSG